MARSPRFFRPGSAAYDAERAKELRRQEREAKQALASAKRTKAGKDAIRKTKNRIARIEREQALVTSRQDARKGLSEDERRTLTSLGIAKQNRVLKYPDHSGSVLPVLIRYPHSPPPKDVPDPFAAAGEDRNALWTLYYSSLARKKRRARRMREAA